MLQRLLIRNFVIVNELDIVFSRGLNVMTGETGAGKSLVIDALNGLLGARTSADVIRQNADYAYLEATIQATPALHQILQEHGFEELLSESSLIISKTIQRNSSRFRLNGQVVNLPLIKDLGRYWLDILGQHESQHLFQAEYHRSLLDQTGDNAYQRLLQQIQASYGAYQDLKHTYHTLLQNQQESQRRLDFLRFQLDEIEQAELVPDEDEHLQQEQKRLAHADKLIRNLQLAYFELYGREDQPSICERLQEVEHLLANSSGMDERLEPWVTELRNMHYQLQDMAHQAKDWSDELPLELNHLTEVEDRLNLIRKLKHKYGHTIDEILAQAESCRQEIQSIKCNQERLEQLQAELAQQEANYHQLACQIQHKRYQLAKNMAPRIEAELKELGMKQTQFVVTLQSDETSISPTGYEQVAFYFSANPGEPPRPLAQIASGGEISRLMLALKLMLKNQQSLATLVFDEVDTGISGKTALIVSQKLARLSQQYQLLCITHLPVIAAMADHHLWIEKRQDTASTQVDVHRLIPEDRHARLAQMAGGKVTASSLRHARELCDQAEHYKADLLQPA